MFFFCNDNGKVYNNNCHIEIILVGLCFTTHIQLKKLKLKLKLF